MKRILFISLLFILSVSICKSQDKGDFRLSIYGQQISYRDKQLPQFGVAGEYFLGHKVSLNYKYGFGYNSDGVLMGHINPSILGILFLAYLGGNSSGDGLILSFMIPEGVSYHIYPNKKLEVAPYINPLGSEINLTSNASFDFSCSFGMAMHFIPAKNFSISPNLGGIVLYQTGEIVPSASISLDYIFD